MWKPLVFLLFLLSLAWFSYAEIYISPNSFSFGEPFSKVDQNFCAGFACVVLDNNAPDLNNVFPDSNYNSVVSSVSWSISVSELESGLKDCNALFSKNGVFVGNFVADVNFTTDGNNFGTCSFDQNLSVGDTGAFVSWRICDYALNCKDLNSFSINYPVPTIISGTLIPVKEVKIQEGNFIKKFVTEPINLFFMLFIIIILLVIVYLAYRKMRNKESSATA